MAKRRSPISFKTINEVIENEKEFENLRQIVKNFDLVDEFKKIFPELKLIAQAVKVDRQILFLKVESAVWKSELNFQKEKVIEKINKHYKTQVIKSIKFL